MKAVITSLLLCLSTSLLISQSFTDALRYSRTLSSGTARTVGIGNSIGALGGDFAVMSINPAGAATFRKSEFSFSPSVALGNIRSTFNGEQSNDDTSAKFFLESAGFVIANRPRSRNWKTKNWAIGINRIADFNQSFSYTGTGEGSITERWLENADNFTPNELDDFETGPAYVVGAIFDFDGDLFYGADIIETDIVTKEQTVDRSGGINEVSLTYGANYKNKFSFGFGLGLPTINFEEDKSYRETDPNSEIPFFDNLRFDESLSVNGVGINLKAGLILHFIPKIRIGLSYESPSWFNVNETFETDVRYQFTDIDTNETFAEAELSPIGEFRYVLRTPGNARVDLAYLHRGENINGFIAAGVSSINYSGNLFNFNSTSNDDLVFEEFLNGSVENELTNSLSYNIGGELAIKKIRFRAGLILEQSPFVVDDGELRNTLSAGLGFRSQRIFVDLAWRSTSNSEGFIPYDVSNTERLQLVDLEARFNKFLMTFGVKF